MSIFSIQPTKDFDKMSNTSRFLMLSILLFLGFSVYLAFQAGFPNSASHFLFYSICILANFFGFILFADFLGKDFNISFLDKCPTDFPSENNFLFMLLCSLGFFSFAIYSVYVAYMELIELIAQPIQFFVCSVMYIISISILLSRWKKY